MTVKALNARERDQRLREKEQLALNISREPISSVHAAAEILTFSSRAAAGSGATPQEEIIRETTPPIREYSPAAEDIAVAPYRENPFALPASTAPALLQTILRSKRARGQTLNYKTMYKGKQNRPKRGK
jgi:PAS domain-containing protein